MSNFNQINDSNIILNSSWRQTLTLEQRSVLTKKIIKTLVEVDRERSSPLNLHLFLCDFIRYSIHIEYEIYTKAKELEEYFHLLAEQIYVSQNKLKGKSLYNIVLI